MFPHVYVYMDRRLKEAKAKAANKPKPFGHGGVKPHITKGSIRKMKPGGGGKKKK